MTARGGLTGSATSPEAATPSWRQPDFVSRNQPSRSGHVLARPQTPAGGRTTVRTLEWIRTGDVMRTRPQNTQPEVTRAPWWRRQVAATKIATVGALIGALATALIGTLAAERRGAPVLAAGRRAGERGVEGARHSRRLLGGVLAWVRGLARRPAENGKSADGPGEGDGSADVATRSEQPPTTPSAT